MYMLVVTSHLQVELRLPEDHVAHGEGRHVTREQMTMEEPLHEAAVELDDTSHHLHTLAPVAG